MFTFNKFNKFTQGIYQNLSKNLLVPASLQIDKKIFLDTDHSELDQKMLNEYS